MRIPRFGALIIVLLFCLAGTSRDLQGPSFGGSIGYRFKVSRSVGLGASLHYSSVAFSEEKIGNDEQDVSDKLTFMMPMIELSMLFR